MTKREEAQARREAKLEAERARIEQMKVYERRTAATRICGIDEAGRGPFAGPVVAGAVILDYEDPAREILYLNDSKKLSEKKRELLYREILSRAVAVGIGYAGAQLIDRMNILQATFHAMRMAISNLRNVAQLVEVDDDVHTLVKKLVRLEITSPDSAYHNTHPAFSSDSADKASVSENIVEGVGKDTIENDMGQCGGENFSDSVIPDYILADAVHIPGITIPQEGIIKGDAKSVSIAAGSIIAKVTRDHIMYEYDRLHPEYGFAAHKGYGTAAHIAAIKEHGMLDIHRRSFIHFL